MKLFKIFVAGLFAVTITSGVAQAELVSSKTLMQTQHSFYNKQQIIDLVNRDDVQSDLVRLGVSKSDAIARINGMTDDEINRLNTELTDGNAGGIVGAVVTVLAVIAILDLLGVTDVYPFIRPINS